MGALFSTGSTTNILPHTQLDTNMISKNNIIKKYNKPPTVILTTCESVKSDYNSLIKNFDTFYIDNRFIPMSRIVTGKGGGYVYVIKATKDVNIICDITTKKIKNNYKEGSKYILKIFPALNRSEDKKEIAITIILSEINNILFPKVYEYGNINSIYPFRKKINENMPKIIESNLYNYMIIEYIDGIPLSNIKSINLQEQKEILFQILYALYSVEKLCTKFRHNDLHPGNILVTKTESPLIFNVDNKEYRMKFKYSIKIIDFGMSSFESKARVISKPISRTLLRFLEEHGISKPVGIIKSLRIKQKNPDLRFWLLIKNALTNKNKRNLGKNIKICNTIKSCLKSEYFNSLES